MLKLIKSVLVAALLFSASANAGIMMSDRAGPSSNAAAPGILVSD